MVTDCITISEIIMKTNRCFFKLYINTFQRIGIDDKNFS